MTKKMVNTATVAFGDCLDILPQLPSQFFHAIVSDPPFGLSDFSAKALSQLKAASGGTWRACRANRSAVPRFVEMAKDQWIGHFFDKISGQLLRVGLPGAHAMIASTPMLQHHVVRSFVEQGWEMRGAVIRLVSTLRGGDRPKGAHLEFPNATVLPRAKYEPWLLFRKPCEGTVAQNMRKFGTGALKRRSRETPFADIIELYKKTPKQEKIAYPHPTLKPLALMEDIVHHVAPAPNAKVLDFCAGSGTTGVAALLRQKDCFLIERDAAYFEMMQKRIKSTGHIVKVFQ